MEKIRPHVLTTGRTFWQFHRKSFTFHCFVILTHCIDWISADPIFEVGQDDKTDGHPATSFKPGGHFSIQSCSKPPPAKANPGQCGADEAVCRWWHTRWSPCLGRYPSPPSCITHTTTQLLLLLRDSWDPHKKRKTRGAQYYLIWSEMETIWNHLMVVRSLRSTFLKSQSHLLHPSLLSHLFHKMWQAAMLKTTSFNILIRLFDNKVWCVSNVLVQYYNTTVFPVIWASL